MTGIERLREHGDKYQERLEGLANDMRAEVYAIADQIERDHADEREAIAWVRERGGLDAVKRRWECLSYYADPVPRSCMEKRLARLQRQIDESHAALGRRRETISELNRRATDLTRENAKRGETIRELSDRAAKQSDEIRVMRDVIAETCARLGVEGTGSTVDDAQVIWREISRRLMPEGMEWPRFESGEQVRPGDRLLDKGGDWFEAGSFVFTCDWWSVRGYQTEGFGELSDKTRRKLDGMAYGTCVKRPAPKVLDADGVEIREKCDVWWICEGDERGVHAERLRVETICPNGLIECSPYNGGTWVYLEPSELYVKEPVLAADGKPLHEGETVYGIGQTQHRFVVRAAGDYEEDEPDGRFCVPCIDKDDGDEECWCDPSQLTHERPDSWERLEKDAGCTATKYNERRGTIFTTKQQVARDLVRRAKKLAGAK